MKFIAVETRDGRVIVPATAVGRIAVAPDGKRADAYDVKGTLLGWSWGSAAEALVEDVAIVPAVPGWRVVTAHDDGEDVGLQHEPIIAWRIEVNAAAGGVWPVTPSWETNQAIHEAHEGGDAYAILPPEGAAMDSHGVLLSGRDDEALRAHLGGLRRYRAAAPARMAAIKAAPKLRLAA